MKIVNVSVKIFLLCFVFTTILLNNIYAQAVESDLDTFNFYKLYFEDLSEYRYETKDIEDANSEGGVIIEYLGIPNIKLREIIFFSSSGKTKIRLYQSASLPDLIWIKQYNYDPFLFPDLIISSERNLIAVRRNNLISIYNGNLEYNIERIETVLTLLP